MVPIGIWLVLLGYTVAYVGIVNAGLTGTPQSDGSVSWSSTPMTIMQAFTGQNPGGGTSSGSASTKPKSGGVPSNPAQNPGGTTGGGLPGEAINPSTGMPFGEGGRGAAVASGPMAGWFHS